MSATMTGAGPSKDAAMARQLGARRKRRDRLMLWLALAATTVGLLFLLSILVTLMVRGMEAMSLRVFTDVTRPPGSDGGLLNAIVGSLIQTAIGAAIGTPIGLLVGTYLSEYASRSRLGDAVRFVSDILLSAPSILIGLFIYQLLVLPFGGFSGLAGSMALAVIVIPIVVRTTEDMLQLIPVTLREAAVALGAPKWKMVVLVCYPAVRSGLITGALLAVARIAGETAPLLFTSLGNLTWSVDLTKPMGSLPVTIYTYAGSPYTDWIALGWTGAMLITLGVLAINIIARVVLRQRN
jgi:phosphate transport system permease protein